MSMGSMMKVSNITNASIEKTLMLIAEAMENQRTRIEP